ncbi:MAG: hypothetical protein KatS3mg057_1306 [Herpetosiphonaceae bacterium]|nr:MAG: hypothetical protein KatS3mg057_1306 [Herpetosiphonaceae bacterium]
MDETMLVMIVLGGLGVLALMVLMLNRSWGNFPTRPSQPFEQQSPEPWRSGWETDGAITGQISSVDQPAHGTTEPIPGLIPIEHPMVQRAAQNALRKGDKTARFIVQDGDRLYLSLDHISDPEQRRIAYEVLRRFNAGENIDIRSFFTVIRQIFKG